MPMGMPGEISDIMIDEKTPAQLFAMHDKSDLEHYFEQQHSSFNMLLESGREAPAFPVTSHFDPEIYRLERDTFFERREMVVEEKIEMQENMKVREKAEAIKDEDPEQRKMSYEAVLKGKFKKEVELKTDKIEIEDMNDEEFE